MRTVIDFTAGGLATFLCLSLVLVSGCAEEADLPIGKLAELNTEQPLQLQPEIKTTVSTPHKLKNGISAPFDITSVIERAKRSLAGKNASRSITPTRVKGGV